jgi:hypothetical protein
MQNPFDRFDPPQGQPQGQPAQGTGPIAAGLDPRMTDVLANHYIWSGQLPYILNEPARARVADRAAEIAGARGLSHDLLPFAFARYRSQHGGPALGEAQPGLRAAAASERPQPSAPRNWRDGPIGLSLAASTNGTSDRFDAAASALGERMVREGASAAAINRAMRPYGFGPVSQHEITRVQNYLKQYPHYSGFFQAVHHEPISGARRLANQFSNSAAGAAAGHYINDVTGGHLDNLTNLAGGDGQLVNLGLAQASRAHPYASAGGHLVAGAALSSGAGRALKGLAAALPEAVAAPAGEALLGGYIESGSNGEQLFDLDRAREGALLAGLTGGSVKGGLGVGSRAVAPLDRDLPLLYAANPQVRPSLGPVISGAWTKLKRGRPVVPYMRRRADAAIDQAHRGAYNEAAAAIGAPILEALLTPERPAIAPNTNFINGRRVRRDVQGLFGVPNQGPFVSPR